MKKLLIIPFLLMTLVFTLTKVNALRRVEYQISESDLWTQNLIESDLVGYPTVNQLRYNDVGAILPTTKLLGLSFIFTHNSLAFDEDDFSSFIDGVLTPPDDPINWLYEYDNIAYPDIESSQITIIDDNGTHIYLLEDMWEYYDTMWSLEEINENYSLFNSINIEYENFVEDFEFMGDVLVNPNQIQMIINTDMSRLLTTSELDGEVPTISVITEMIKLNIYDGLVLTDEKEYFLEDEIDLEDLDLQPPKEGYTLLGIVSNTGVYIENFRNINPDWLNEDGELDVYTRYITDDGLVVEGNLITPAPLWLQDVLRPIGLNSYFGYFIIFFILIIGVTILLSKMSANYFIYVVFYSSITILFYSLGLMQFYMLLLIILAMILLVVFLIRGGFRID